MLAFALSLFFPTFSLSHTHTHKSNESNPNEHINCVFVKTNCGFSKYRIQLKSYHQSSMRRIISMIVDFYECRARCRRAYLIVSNSSDNVWYVCVCVWLAVRVFYLQHVTDKLNGFFSLFCCCLLYSIVSHETDSNEIAGDHSQMKYTMLYQIHQPNFKYLY